MGAWLKLNGEAIYATRKWKIPAEGPSKMLKYNKRKKVLRWSFREIGVKDIRFTRNKANTKLYAIVLGNPESDDYQIKCLAKGEKIATGKISKISLVATDEEVKWGQTADGLTIKFPENGVSEIANAFRIEVEGRLLY